MIKQYKITGQNWSQISNAGQIGTCFIENLDDGYIRIFHSDTITPDNSNKTQGYKMSMNETVQLIPDNQSDIFYAICNTLTDTGLLNVDVKDY